MKNWQTLAVVSICLAVGTLHAQAASKVWDGGTGNWTNNNWSGGGAKPAAGDAVQVNSGTVTLSGSTEMLGSFQIAGATLVFTNWSTALKATNVTVQSGGTLAIAAAFTTSSPSNRVNVLCTNFYLASGGLVDAKGKGFRAQNGPGKGATDTSATWRGGGGGYGGGGGRSKNDTAAGGPVYGATNAPVLPGSGGGNTGGGAGGGAARIVASGWLVLNGVIDADGNPGADVASGEDNNGGGSGGAIYLTCGTFHATNGVLRARGGNTGYVMPGSLNGYGGKGGGGRIALDYGTMGTCTGLQITAAAATLGQGTPDYGTLFMSGKGLLNETLSTPRFRSVKILIPSFTNWAVTTLTVTNCDLDLGISQTTVKATNSVRALQNAYLRVKGIQARGDVLVRTPTVVLNSLSASNLTINGGSLSLGATDNTVGPTLSCVKNLLLTNAAAFHVYGGKTNGIAANYSGLVTVTGTVTVAGGSGNSWIYPYAHTTDGGAPLFRAGNVTLAANSGFDAQDRGYAANNGPGKPANNERAPGHGGRGGGGRGGNPGGPVYGYTNAPIRPGSGGGPSSEAGAGGGLIRMEVADTLTLNGKLLANATVVIKSPGSGGGVFVTCKRLAGTGSIEANGRNSQHTTVVNGSGGGRIAVWYGSAVRDFLSLIVSNKPVPQTRSATSYAGLTATASCGSGTHANDQPHPGTVRFLTIQAVPDIRNDRVSSLQKTSATLNGTLVSTGLAATAASVFWGQTDGSTNGTWAFSNPFVSPAEGPLPHSTGLTADRQYYYAYRGTNRYGTSWATPSQYFISSEVTLQASGPNAYEEGTRAVTVTVARASTLTNAPLTVYYTVGGTATPTNDYAALSGSILMRAGTWRTNLLVRPNFDTTPESAETVILTLSNGCYVVGASNSVTVNIVDATPAPGLNTNLAVGSWSDGAVWSQGRPPIAGDEVIVASSVTLGTTSPMLKSCTVRATGTLVFTNWSTQLQATNVTVLSGGALTAAGPFASSAMSNRVNVLCTNFYLASGGTVTAKGKGYSGQNGPGKGQTNGRAGGGAGYGGVGGVAVNNEAAGGPTYGATNAPTRPGSGGGQTGGGAGGGAVRIVASGALTLNGVLDADGMDGTNGGTENFNGGGSGGAVYLTCGVFTGTNGTVSVRGGSSGTASGGGHQNGGKGGGGRIAVVYQTRGVCTGLQFTASAATVGQGTPDYGTLYLSDNGLVNATLSTPRFRGAKILIPSFTNWSVNALTVTNCDLDLGISATQVQVTNAVNLLAGSFFRAQSLRAGGNLLVRGTSAAVLQSAAASNIVLDAATLSAGVRDGVAGPTVSCVRDLSLINAAALHVYGGKTNGLSVSYGSLVSVTGTVTVGGGAGNSWVYPYAHTTDGGAPLFRAGNVTLAANSGFDARNLGYGIAQGPGKAASWEQGAGHGGQGGGGSGGVHGGPVYGSTNAPIRPGSGGGGNESGPGGGLIRMEVGDTLTLNGKLLASASEDRKSPGSGGAVFVTCARLTGTGQIAADGLNSHNPDRVNGSGGGRIAVWHGSFVPANLAKILAGQVDARRVVTATSYPGLTATAACGSGTYPGADQAQPGTVRFLEIVAPAGSLFLFR